MSHFTAVHTIITDANILISCLRDCGLRVTNQATIRGYNGTLSSITYPIVGCSDTLQQDLGYALASDDTYTCNFHSEAAVGALMQRVAQMYATKSSLAAAATQRGLTGANVNVLVHAN
ncbi:hypothetical protein [Microcoleus phage My-WqHQDG]|nr:hypothetical protein [Microcoleus phage My-WqHQDG]